MSMPRCSKSDQEGLIPKDEDEEEGSSRKKRYTRLGNTVWGADDLPLTIKFKNYLSGMTHSEQEAVAKHCSDVCIGHLFFRVIH